MKKSAIACFMLVLALGGIGLFPVQRISAQSATTEIDLALHCAGQGPVVGSAVLKLTMMMAPIQLNCSDSTDRGATQHLILNGTLGSFSGQVNASGNGDPNGTNCSFAGTSLPFDITCTDASSTPARRVRFSIQ
jgi:hypothetical protein